ncbi:MAG: response regulator [Oligoflexia bacterium]|nr:response regulator [Oligoflexia bacterium]
MKTPPVQGTSGDLIKEVSTLVNHVTGIELGHRQAHMVESKLVRRMMDLGMTAAEEYHAYLRDNLKSELPALVSLLTTHHTFFFREFFHFEYLEKEALPKLIEQLRKEGRRTLKIWSAACSRGQEVYSLSMCLHNYLRQFAPDIGYEILGSDVDPESVAFARNGVYRWDEVKEIPLAYLASHWARGTGEIADFVKAKSSIKLPCAFEVVNLFDMAAKVSGRSFDLIFCRNVFIYFSQDQIKVLMNGLMNYLQPEGYLFLGISESLGGTQLPISHLGQSIYARKKATQPASQPRSAPAANIPPPLSSPAPIAATKAPPGVTPSRPMTPAAAPALPVSNERPLRVLCVDDSAVILTLMKKLLSPEFGFEVVATAENGLDAAEKLKTHKVDLITLDIHMPKQTGIEFLQTNRGLPPVVMVSSVNRENADLALKALELGAKDYIEKPSFSDLTHRGDEIRMKLRSAATAPALRPGATTLERSFQSSELIRNPENKFRVIVAGLGDLKKLTATLREFRNPQPPTVILIHGSESAIPALAAQLKIGCWTSARLLSEGGGLAINQLTLADMAKSFAEVRRLAFGKRTSILVYGGIPRRFVHELTSWPVSQLVVEELETNVKLIGREPGGHDTHVVPATSFCYLSEAFFSKDVPSGKEAA